MADPRNPARPPTPPQPMGPVATPGAYRPGPAAAPEHAPVVPGVPAPTPQEDKEREERKKAKTEHEAAVAEARRTGKPIPKPPATTTQHKTFAAGKPTAVRVRVMVAATGAPRDFAADVIGTDDLGNLNLRLRNEARAEMLSVPAAEDAEPNVYPVWLPIDAEGLPPLPATPEHAEKPAPHSKS
jgi:hypothetical protein